MLEKGRGRGDSRECRNWRGERELMNAAIPRPLRDGRATRACVYLFCHQVFFDTRWRCCLERSFSRRPLLNAGLLCNKRINLWFVFRVCCTSSQHRLFLFVSARACHRNAPREIAFNLPLSFLDTASKHAVAVSFLMRLPVVAHLPPNLTLSEYPSSSLKDYTNETGQKQNTQN